MKLPGDLLTSTYDEDEFIEVVISVAGRAKPIGCSETDRLSKEVKLLVVVPEGPGEFRMRFMSLGSRSAFLNEDRIAHSVELEPR